MSKRKIVSVVLLCLLLSVPAISHAKVTLVHNGKPSAIIVIPEGSDASIADDLILYIKKSSGAELKVFAENNLPENSTGNRIYLGTTQYARKQGIDLSQTRLTDQGFIICTPTDGTLVIAGSTPYATRWGITSFLENELGIRWCMPGELGVVVPKHKDIVIGNIDRVEKPSFELRELWGYRNEPGDHGRWRIQLKDTGPWISRISVGHAYYQYLPPEKYFKKHPEYFALWEGKRNPAQICVSNPEVQKLCIEGVKKVLRKNPQLVYASMSPNDGHVFCQCEKCRKLDRPGGDYARRTLWLANKVAREIAKEFPGKGVAFYAYADHHKCPDDLKPEDNVAVFFARWLSCRRHPFTSSCPKMPEREDILKWSKITKHMYMREYYNRWEGDVMPWVGVRTVAEDLKWYHSIGILGVDADGMQCFNDGYYLSWYVIYKLLWNVNQDWREIVDDYITNFYGTAAPAMKRYYMRQINAYAGMDHKNIYTKDLLSKLDSDLKQAEKLADDDSIVACRIALSRRFLEGTEYCVDILNRDKDYQSKPAWKKLRCIAGKRNELKAFIKKSKNENADPRWIHWLEYFVKSRTKHYAELYNSFSAEGTRFVFLEDFMQPDKPKGIMQVKRGKLEWRKGYITGDNLQVVWKIPLSTKFSKMSVLVYSYRRRADYATFANRRSRDVGPMVLKFSADGGKTWTIEKTLKISGWKHSQIDISSILPSNPSELVILMQTPPHSRYDIRLADLKVIGSISDTKGL